MTLDKTMLETNIKDARIDSYIQAIMRLTGENPDVIFNEMLKYTEEFKCDTLDKKVILKITSSRGLSHLWTFPIRSNRKGCWFLFKYNRGPLLLAAKDGAFAVDHRTMYSGNQEISESNDVDCLYCICSRRCISTVAW